MSAPKTVRCAVYTRKSSEEGLDQAFNSLDAQREAGLDYIRSQKHEGWSALPDQYDDGGYSGGTTERPGLKQLLSDVERGRIDVVVVYKVDRLSRSLGDFARIMQLFDERGVSFVSVTQQFNTTTSMGRLTLNMLLSFAQFEREVTGERIRDKLAASRRKGYWVAGRPPLGYRRSGPDLEIVEEEAGIIRRVFAMYADGIAPLEIAKALRDDGAASARWTSSSGNKHGGKALTPKQVHRILTNPAYIGRVRHGEETFEGRHEPIIERDLWDRVQSRIAQRERAASASWTHSHLLKGRLRTHEGSAMSPTSVQRPSGEGGAKKRVPYYVSQKSLREGYDACPIRSINARHLDDLIRAVVLDQLDREGATAVARLASHERDRRIRDAIKSITIAPDSVRVSLSKSAIAACRRIDAPKNSKQDPAERPTCAITPDIDDRGETIELRLAVQIRRLDGRRMILAPDGSDLTTSEAPAPVEHIVRAIGTAYRWRRDLLDSGDSMQALSDREGVSESQVRKLLALTMLGPRALKAALTGTLPGRVGLDELLRAARRPDWSEQAAYLGIA